MKHEAAVGRYWAVSHGHRNDSRSRRGRGTPRAFGVAHGRYGRAGRRLCTRRGTKARWHVVSTSPLTPRSITRPMVMGPGATRPGRPNRERRPSDRKSHAGPCRSRRRKPRSGRRPDPPGRCCDHRGWRPFDQALVPAPLSPRRPGSGSPRRDKGDRVRDPVVVLMHSWPRSTPAALRRLIAHFKSEGASFATVAQRSDDERAALPPSGRQPRQ